MPVPRRLPHLAPLAPSPIVFLTVVTRNRRAILANAASFACLTDIWRRSPEIDGWFVGDFLLMPDHAHLFARAAQDAKSLSEWMETWKSVSARRLSRTLQIDLPFWQRDYFDRFLRSADDYSQKWEYVAANPVRKGLCPTPEEWPWKGRLFDLWF